MSFIALPDKTVIDKYGKIVFFSRERFQKDIVEGNACFICGAFPGTKTFNNEHVLPKWILSKYKLFDRNITLPHFKNQTYGRYKIPCCAECNTRMKNHYEDPISSLFKQGYGAIRKYIEENGYELIFTWLCLIYLKTHLKSRLIRKSADERIDEGNIGAEFNYGLLHHVHAIARSFYSESIIEKDVLGTTILLRAFVKNEWFESFDYKDLDAPAAMSLRFGEFCLFAILDDSCMACAVPAFANKIQRFTAPSAPIQLCEYFAEMCYVSMMLREKPRYGTDMDLINETSREVAEVPELVELKEHDPSLMGYLKHGMCEPLLKDHPEKQKLEDLIRTGKTSFLFDENGKFLEHTSIYSIVKIEK